MGKTVVEPFITISPARLIWAINKINKMKKILKNRFIPVLLLVYFNF